MPLVFAHLDQVFAPALDLNPTTTPPTPVYPKSQSRSKLSIRKKKTPTTSRFFLLVSVSNSIRHHLHYKTPQQSQRPNNQKSPNQLSQLKHSLPLFPAPQISSSLPPSLPKTLTVQPNPSYLPPMSAKRSRISRSSSLGDACSFNQTQPFDPPAPRREKPPMILHSVNVSSSPVPKPEPPPRRNIFTLGPPCHDPIDKSKSSRSFLESCHRCNKKFSEKDDIFMYSYLCAFCSPECRDIQIVMDKQLEQSKTNADKMERGDTQFGARSRNGVVSGVRS